MISKQGRLVVPFENNSTVWTRDLLTFEDLYVLIVTTQISAINDMTCGRYERRNASTIGHGHTLDPKTAIKSPIHENAALYLSVRPTSNLAQRVAHIFTASLSTDRKSPTSLKNACRVSNMVLVSPRVYKVTKHLPTRFRITRPGAGYGSAAEMILMKTFSNSPCFGLRSP
jgi:hypothetical protein